MNMEENNNTVPPPEPPQDPNMYYGDGGYQGQKLMIPWEDTNKEFMSRIVDTAKLVITKPREFFRDYNFDNELKMPFFYGMIVGTASMVVYYIWQIIFSSVIMGMVSQMGNMRNNPLGAMMGGAGSGVIGIFLAPFIIAAGLFISAGLYHLFLMLFKGCNRPFATTFNVVAYSATANLLMIIPICGGHIAGIYALVLNAIGLKETHETDQWRAVMAVLGPILVVCLCCVLFAFVIGFGAAAAGAR